MKFFLDTNICIYFLKGVSQNIIKKIARLNPSDIKIPSIVKAELLYGVEKSRKIKENKIVVTNFLFPFEIIPFDDTAAGQYSKIRSFLEKHGEIVRPNDLLIASIVLANQATLVTNNVKEFKRVKGLKVVNWV